MGGSFAKWIITRCYQLGIGVNPRCQRFDPCRIASISDHPHPELCVYIYAICIITITLWFVNVLYIYTIWLYIIIYIYTHVYVYIYIGGKIGYPGTQEFQGQSPYCKSALMWFFSWTKTSKLLRLDKVVRYLPPKANEVLVFLIMWFPSYLLITYYKYVQIKDQI